jgi:prefoldin subunit 4
MYREYGQIIPLHHLTSCRHRYKIGECFFTLPISEAQELISKSTEKIENDVGALESKLGLLRDEMQNLKVTLYSRFGRSINLEL